MKRFAALLGPLVLLGASFAQNVEFSPRSIVVNPVETFSVEVWNNKDQSGNNTPTYNIGESIRIGVRVSESAYVYLFNVRSSGEVVQILPNRYDQEGRNNFLQAGVIRTFPPEGARYTFDVDGPQGLDKVIAVASKEQLDTSTLADFRADATFASSDLGEEGFARSFSIVVRPVPQDSWVTDTFLFNVGRGGAQITPQPTQPAASGTLQVTSNPSGAAVMVNGRQVGTTPLRYGTAAGRYDVSLSLSGYQGFTTSVQIEGGRTAPLDVNLDRAGNTPQPAEVLFRQPRLLAYPGSNVTSVRANGSELVADFSSRRDLSAIFEHFERQLLQSGYRQRGFEERNNSVRASYVQGNELLLLNLQGRGNSGGYRLTISFE